MKAAGEALLVVLERCCRDKTSKNVKLEPKFRDILRHLAITEKHDATMRCALRDTFS